MRRIFNVSLVAGLAIIVGLIVGCSDNDSNTTAPLTGEGRVQISMIDAPGDYEEVNIEVVEVRVHRADADSMSGWETISSDTTYVNLLDLTDGNYVVLADSVLAAGHYTQVRLILGENNNVVVDGETHDLTIPSSGQSGLKLNHPFTIEDGTIYGMTLDFDANRSIHRTGNGRYMMRPVIRMIVDMMSGSLSGTVEPVDARAMITAVAGADTAFAYADTLTGDFRFHMLNAGAHDLTFSAMVGAYQDIMMFDVMVTAGQDNDLGTVVLEAE